MSDYLDTDYLDKLKQLKAEYEADLSSIESDHADLKANLNELERKQNELRRLIEGVDGVLSDITGGNGPTQAAAVVPPPTVYGDGATSSQESITTTNGLSEKLSRRMLILRMLPEFRGETFTAREVREKFVEQYLEAEPPNFPQAINGLLHRMAERGEIEQIGRQGTGPTDPWLYREKNPEENLLGP